MILNSMCFQDPTLSDLYFVVTKISSMTLQFEKLINNLYAKRTISENEVAKPAFFVVITW